MQRFELTKSLKHPGGSLKDDGVLATPVGRGGRESTDAVLEES